MAIVKISGLGAGGGGGAGVVVLGSGTGSSERCGNGNTSSGAYSTVLGRNNSASASCSTISGGYINTASGYSSTISGGYNNVASGDCSTVSGGYLNVASSNYATIPGGYSNSATGLCSTISGGYCNIADAGLSSIFGSGTSCVNGPAASYIIGSVASIIQYVGAKSSLHSINGSRQVSIVNNASSTKFILNSISSSYNSVIDGATRSSIYNSFDSKICAFSANGVDVSNISQSTDSCVVDYCGSGVFSGRITNSDYSCLQGVVRSSISNSYYGRVTQSNYSSVHNVDNSYIQGSDYSSISNATSSSILASTTGLYNTILYGRDSQICGAGISYSMANGLCALVQNYGQRAHSNGAFSNGIQGGSQQVEFIQRAETTDATTTTLYSDGASQEIVIANNSQLLLNVLVQGFDQAGVESATIQKYLVVKNVAGTPSLVHQDTIKSHYTNGALAINTPLNPINDSILVQVNGLNAVNMYWTAYIFGVEVRV
jgi:hypothetical protein